ncbi:50S ribosomal protein L6 [Garciella nitratireducens]|uniref:Large ribosomal subunit protein uL6 n=1 Tax=Garciella nitratireducens DSM 15102 TaxID=1121911 RepID=A0A1T4PRI8_9FIRM|nr:50S ribosomal protein L6 [Garciella nitratireducens]RBP44894.1 LSU ribosomal protein L6P [Garciella nitratireducens]SJZ94165.1 LSU ribosomal protein L6P [Garciella nitratireducens DSM 15102]
MSRIGRLPVVLPNGVEAKLDGNTLTIKGPKGQLVKTFHKDMKITIQDNQIVVERPTENKLHKSLHGLTRSLIQNMVDGVSKGFEKTLEINGVGYRAQKQGKKLILNLGYSHPIEMEDPEGITVEVPSNTKIIVKGIDKELVGAHAANIRKQREPEPYKGKGIKYENEVIRRKEGKAGK